MASKGAIILAAGMGTRMKTQRPKVLHEIGRRPMIGHVLKTLSEAGINDSVVVIGAGAQSLKEALPGLRFALQEPQLGTGHAVMAAREDFEDFKGELVILYGDVPLIRAATLLAMFDRIGEEARDSLVILGFRAEDPSGYGRLRLGHEGGLEAIVEEREAAPEDLAIDLCNSGALAGHAALIFELLEAVNADNSKGEYYLTDIVKIARAAGKGVAVIEAEEEEVMGVNSMADLAAAEAAFQVRRRTEAMKMGVQLVNPDSVFFADDTQIDPGTIIGPNVVFGPGVRIGKDVRIEAFCHLEGCEIEDGAIIGPFARLRPGVRIGPGAKIGNFVELKKSYMHKGAKANHLAYIGDAEVGEGTNIGAGTITCNYDGIEKHRTEIGKGVLIGSNSALIAPIKIGDGAIVGAGSALSEDVEDDALAMERAKLTVKKGWARKFWRKRKKKGRQGD